VSTSNATIVNTASTQTNATVKTEGAPTATNLASVFDAEHEESMQSIGKLVQDLFHHDRVKVEAALQALGLNLSSDESKSNHIVTVGGCAVLVHLVKGCLTKSARLHAVHNWIEHAELKTLGMLTLGMLLFVIAQLTAINHESRVGITASGGVEAVVGVMKAFPKCDELQRVACMVLINLTACNIGRNDAIKSGGIKVVLDAVNNHLSSARVCLDAIWAIKNIVTGSKANTELLISLGGVTAAATVKNRWLNHEGVQTQVRSLVALIVEELKTWI
jgi:hypothetical protein